MRTRALSTFSITMTICMTIACLLGIAIQGEAASPSTNLPVRTLHMVIGDPEKTEMGQVAKAFKQYVEEKSAGALKVSYSFALDPNEGENLHFHLVQTGKLDMAIGGIGNLVPMAKRLSLLMLPYLFENVDDVVKGTQGKAAELLNAYAMDAGLRVLTWTYSGFRHISNARHPITEMKDMRGLRFRIPQSQVMALTYSAFGGIPSMVPWEKTITALEDKAVDGLCYGYIGFEAMNFLGAGQKYLTEIHYTYHLQPLVISEKVFSSLTQEQQKLLQDAGKYAQQQVLLFVKTQTEQSKAALVAKGLKISSLKNEADWKQVAITQVWPKALKDIGGIETVNAYLKASGRPPVE